MNAIQQPATHAANDDPQEQITLLRAALNKALAREANLLCLPFTVQVESRPAITDREPDFCQEAEYVERKIDNDLVWKAAESILDRYMTEWEYEALRLQKRRDAA